MPRAGEDERHRAALRASRIILVAMGVAALLIALHPPELVGIFAQLGIYGLVAASVAPVALGIFVRDVNARHAFAAALVGPAVHFGHHGAVVWLGGGFLNPAVSATEGVLASVATLGASPSPAASPAGEPSAASPPAYEPAPDPPGPCPSGASRCGGGRVGPEAWGLGS